VPHCKPGSEDEAVEALVEIGEYLKRAGYHFITPTPLTHSRVNAREGNARARSLRDVFGWSRPFEPGLLPPEIQAALERAGALERISSLPGLSRQSSLDARNKSGHDDFMQSESGSSPDRALYRSSVRFSSLDDDLLVHSAYPTDAPDSVFFGPDSYRFARVLKTALNRRGAESVRSAVEIGCGTGVGGLVVARALNMPDLRLVLTDINDKALSLTRANLMLAGGIPAEIRRSDLLNDVDGSFDLIVANPPYLNDPAGRAYRHGGGAHGEALSFRILEEGLPRLNRGGRLILYTGVAIVEGIDPLRARLDGIAERHGVEISYQEVDPDVFGEELDTPAYAQAERIAAVSLIARRV
jgi:hypothetical protein